MHVHALSDQGPWRFEAAAGGFAAGIDGLRVAMVWTGRDLAGHGHADPFAAAPVTYIPWY